MAFIEKMSIRGIRSFSPNRDETIEFYSPLTMIVGANGCGKTTIIEALKYSCTGTLPPGARNGQSFVNDPAVTDTTEVKANIKLRFQNRAGYTSVVTRSLQVLKKKSKLEFKALDGVIRSTNAQNEKVSSSQKCSDLDKMVPEMLAVSAPILENVIFCHQEESSWPMQEGLVLKKKFDDIFESTRYAKALEALIKAKKEYNDKAKDFKVELAELGAHMQGASDAKRELATCEASQDTCEMDVRSSEEKIARIEDKIKRCKDTIAAGQGAVAELKELRRQVGESERRIEDKRKGITEILSESNDELKASLANFENNTQSRSQEQRALQRNVDVLQNEIAQLRASTDELNMKRGQGESMKQTIVDLNAKLVEECTRVARQLDMQSPFGSSSAATNSAQVSVGFKKFIQQLQAKIDENQREMDSSLKKLREEVNRLQKENMDAKGLHNKYNFELESKRDELNKLGAEGDRRSLELSQYTGARSALQTAEREFDEAKRAHDDYMEQFPTKSSDIKKMLKDVSDEIRYLSEATASDAQLLSELNLGRQELAAISATEKQLEREREGICSDIASAFATHREALSRAPPSSSVEELTLLVQQLSTSTIDKRRQLATQKDGITRIRSELSGAKAILKQEQQTQTELNARLDQIRMERVALTEECVTGINRLRRCEILASEFDDSADLRAENCSVDELVAAAVETEERAYEYKSVFESSRLFLRKMEKARKKANGACPCCLRGMAADLLPVYESNVKKLFNIRDLIGTETDYQRTLENAKQLTGKVKALERLVQPLTGIQNDLEISRSKTIELTPKIEQLTASESSANEAIVALETQLSAQDRVCALLSELRSRWASAEQRIEELTQRKKRHTQSLLMGSLSASSLSSSTSDADGVKSIEELEDQQRKRADRKDELIARKDKLVNEEGALTKRMYHLKGQLTEAEKQLLNAKQRSTKLIELENAMRARSGDIERLEGEIRTLVGKKDEAARTVAGAESHYKAATTELAAKEQSLNQQYNLVKSKYELILRQNEQIESLEKKLTEMDLNGIVGRLDSIQSSIYSKEENIRTLQPRISSLSAELSSHENRRRSVKDNLDLRELIAQHEQLTASLIQTERRVGTSVNDIAVAERDAERAEQEKRRLTSEKDKLVGNLEIYRKQIKELNQKLQNSSFKGIEERFRKKSIQHETTLLAAADLGLYYDALDKAIQNFHVLKIKEINKIIRELWQLIYKGQDIDMIELESGQEANDASAAAKGRRSYHYRVVMRKGDVPLDMRGRCSAGQRVLAAIVIRLALAETFCLNCGILALDEPTTNLDDANKAGLAHALARIIVNRSRQQNFQLICITHDEDFVRIMGNELSAVSNFSLPEFYFRVSREEDEDALVHTGAAAGAAPAGLNGRFFSRIDRIRWDDM